MKKRWQVVVIGRGWEYRTVLRQTFLTKIGALRYAKAMRDLDTQVGAIVPLTYNVERIPSPLCDPWDPK